MTQEKQSETNLSAITLLTFDPTARMAYLYLQPPGGISVKSIVPEMIGQHLNDADARLDYDSSGERIGAEFPAKDSQDALLTAYTIAQAVRPR